MPAGAERTPFALFAAHLLTIWGLALSNLLLGFAIVVGVVRWRRLPGLSKPARPLFRLAIAYLLLLLAAIAASIDVRTSARALSEIFGFGTLGLALLLVQGERRVRWLFDALIVTGVVVAAWGLGQLAFGFGDLEHRIRGPFSHYMTFAGYLLLIDLLLVARLLGRRTEIVGGGATSLLDRGAVAWPAVALMSIALLSSLTRGAWLALAGALCLLVGLARRRLLLLAPVVVLALVVVSPVPVFARLLSIADLADVSNYDRICMADAGLRMIGERPLLGLGPDQVRLVYPIYRHPTAPRLLVPHLHNAYLQLAAERGIPALSVYLALLGSSTLAAWRGFRRGGSGAELHLGVLGALAAFALAGLFENNWGDTELQRVVLLLLAAPFVLETQESIA